jgi:hypothetical protein
MPIKMIELEMDALAKLEAAKWSSDESLSAVVRRAQFPGKPHVARELLADFKRRAGRSPLSDEALDQMDKAQKNPPRSSSHWD